eukprot:CAMPEP_0204322926 /NCGR_PEP_ID=MMETSP0469-20131031/9016_1 /ASSEMBLY_ACC=CAM_ASM_000384 /TAXON_ID=2969 /ORGANISM="Oxyrrhis marina" /LENGTH=37 /DNA_ID= /DNA_START= /DNA_END= /DNA_ORIENTATION=
MSPWQFLAITLTRPRTGTPAPATAGRCWAEPPRVGRA